MSREENIQNAKDIGIWKDEWDGLEDTDLDEIIKAELQAVEEENTPPPPRLHVTGIRGKFHLQDDPIPVSYILTSASLHTLQQQPAPCIMGVFTNYSRSISGGSRGSAARESRR